MTRLTSQKLLELIQKTDKRALERLEELAQTNYVHKAYRGEGSIANSWFDATIHILEANGFKVDYMTSEERTALLHPSSRLRIVKND